MRRSLRDDLDNLLEVLEAHIMQEQIGVVIKPPRTDRSPLRRWHCHGVWRAGPSPGCAADVGRLEAFALCPDAEGDIVDVGRDRVGDSDLVCTAQLPQTCASRWTLIICCAYRPRRRRGWKHAPRRSGATCASGRRWRCSRPQLPSGPPDPTALQQSNAGSEELPLYSADATKR